MVPLDPGFDARIRRYGSESATGHHLTATVCSLLSPLSPFYDLHAHLSPISWIPFDVNSPHLSENMCFTGNDAPRSPGRRDKDPAAGESKPALRACEACGCSFLRILGGLVRSVHGETFTRGCAVLLRSRWGEWCVCGTPASGGMGRIRPHCPC